MDKLITQVAYKDHTWFFMEGEDEESFYKFDTIQQAIECCEENGWTYDIS